jgi:hypothetical protein
MFYDDINALLVRQPHHFLGRCESGSERLSFGHPVNWLSGSEAG